MDDLVSRDFYYVLYTTLLANAPVLTGNMVENITLEDYGDYWLITVSGPRDGYDYARKVNEQILPTQSGKNKGRVNYHWIERVIQQVAYLFGTEVNYEIS